MSDRERNIDLLCGVIDALPCRAALLSAEGQTAYVSEKGGVLDYVDFTGFEQIREIVKSGKPSSSNVVLEGEQSSERGLLELFPVFSNGVIIGILVMFHPEDNENIPVFGGNLKAKKQDYAAKQIEALIAVYGDTVEGKKRAAGELGIGLSSLYRILANSRNK